jgi:divalent metal cation (Fe/Co/Zn/Cd) transporter
MSKAIGFILTITGITLGVWVWQMLSFPGPAPLQTFPVAAIAAAMISVGIRYILKGAKQDKEKKLKKQAEKAAKEEAKKGAAP